MDSSYKEACDRVILTRANTKPGLVFDKLMSDEEVLHLLTNLQEQASCVSTCEDKTIKTNTQN